MSGHSKWHSIKHKKAITDAKKGKVLTKHSKLLLIAGRHDPNPETNTALRNAIDNAKSDNVPNTNIDRILKKLAGNDKDAAQISEQVYEGYAPESIPVIVTALTDNPNRTMPEVRNLFQKYGGHLGNVGSLKFLFNHIGVIEISSAGHKEDELFELAIDAGAEDFTFGAEESEILTKFEALGHVRNALAVKGIKILKSEPQYRAKDPKMISDKAVLERIESFLEALESLDDVNEVFAGFDVDEKILS